MEKKELTPASKDLQIIRQSSLKSVPEICNLLDYQPEGLNELLRLTEILCEYVIFGNTVDEVKKDIKKFDDYIKNGRPINVKVGYKKE